MRVSLSRGPYAFEDFRRLVEGLECVKSEGGLPRSQIYLLLRSWRITLEGWVKYTYQLSRVRNRALQEGRAWPDSLQESLSVSRENGIFRCAWQMCTISGNTCVLERKGCVLRWNGKVRHRSESRPF
jgi:hypothetical protein